MGRHQGGLVPGLDRGHHGAEGDKGLARPDLPVQEAPHRPRIPHIRAYLGQGARLRSGEVERQRGQQPGNQPGAPPELVPTAVSLPPPPLEEGELQTVQLVE